MSRIAAVYVGPYAALPRGAELRDPETGESLDDPQSLCEGLSGAFCHYYADPAPAGRRASSGAGRDVLFAPWGGKVRADGPARVVDWDRPEGTFWSDLLGVDREAEVEAFRRAYAEELAQLAAAAGGELEFGWGVIFTNE
jgi:hypothetical protein